MSDITVVEFGTQGPPGPQGPQGDPGPTYTGTAPIDVTGTVVSHNASGVSPGTFTKTTVDAKGHVTVGANIAGSAPIAFDGTTITHNDSPVTPGGFTYASVTVDAKGHVTAASSGASPTTYTGTAPIDVTGSVISLNSTAVTPGSYTYGSFTVDVKGRLTAAASGAPPTTYTGTAPIDVTGSVVSHNATAVTPGSYTYASLTVDAKGHLTAASNGTPPTTYTGTAPIDVTGSVVSHNNTAVTPGAYTYASLTVDAKGHLTAASNGTAPTTYTGTAPINVTGSVVSHDASGVTPGSWTRVTVDAKGHATAGANNLTAADVSGFSGTAPITYSSGVIAHDTTAVTPGSYTAANITVDSRGHITAAANGSGGSAGIDRTGTVIEFAEGWTSNVLAGSTGWAETGSAWTTGNNGGETFGGATFVSTATGNASIRKGTFDNAWWNSVNTGFGSGDYEYLWFFRIIGGLAAVGNDYKLAIGMVDNSSGDTDPSFTDMTEGVAFVYNRAVTTKWRSLVGSTYTNTTIDVAATDFYVLSSRRLLTANGDAINGFRFGIQSASSYMAGGSFTNLDVANAGPSMSLIPAFIFTRSSGTASRTFTVGFSSGRFKFN